MKVKSEVKSVFDPLIQRNILRAARLKSTIGCIHVDKDDVTEKQAVSKANGKKLFQLMNFRCSLCQIGFDDLQQQRSHFKSDWHVCNIKQKISGKEALSESNFQETLEQDVAEFSDHVDNSKDDDGDDDEDVMKTDRRQPKVTFTTDAHCFSIYRALLETKSKGTCIRCTLLEDSMKSLEKESNWVILMLSAGHFVAAVFHKREVIVHKTIHRYVVRAKRGTVQSQRDGKQSGKSPRSAGAHIRRQNEIALALEIKDLLDKWKPLIEHADRIFLKWPQTNKSILFDGKDPILSKADSRLTKVPFITGRPTFEELKRIHTLLSTFVLQDIQHGTDDNKEEADVFDDEIGRYRMQLKS